MFLLVLPLSCIDKKICSYGHQGLILWFPSPHECGNQVLASLEPITAAKPVLLSPSEGAAVSCRVGSLHEDRVYSPNFETPPIKGSFTSSRFVSLQTLEGWCVYGCYDREICT